MGKDFEKRPLTPVLKEKPETLEHCIWRKNVIVGHKETTELIDKTINEVRATKRVMRKSIHDTREVIDSWNDYNDKYDSAVKKFGHRINRSLQRDELHKLLVDANQRANGHHKVPTKCFLAKKQIKVIVDTKRKPFTCYK